MSSGTTDLGATIGGGGGGGGGVTSLNTLTGDLALTTGPNIVVTPSGSDIAIGVTDPIVVSEVDIKSGGTIYGTIESGLTTPSGVAGAVGMVGNQPTGSTLTLYTANQSAATADVRIETGNSSTINSGNIELVTGTSQASPGSGNITLTTGLGFSSPRGLIQFQDGTQSAKYQVMLTQDVNGSMNWATALPATDGTPSIEFLNRNLNMGNAVTVDWSGQNQTTVNEILMQGVSQAGMYTMTTTTSTVGYGDVYTNGGSNFTGAETNGGGTTQLFYGFDGVSIVADYTFTLSSPQTILSGTTYTIGSNSYTVTSSIISSSTLVTAGIAQPPAGGGTLVYNSGPTLGDQPFMSFTLQGTLTLVTGSGDPTVTFTGYSYAPQGILIQSAGQILAPGGDITLLTGVSGGGVNSGNVNLLTGPANGGNAGNINLTGGLNTGLGNGGGVILTGGATAEDGALAGNVTITGGNNSITPGQSGGVSITDGNGTTGIIVQAGASGTGTVAINGLMAILPMQNSDPTGLTGAIYYNISTNKIRWFNGTAWADLT